MSGPQVTLARMREFGIRPDRDLGQHFLVDDNVLDVAGRLMALEADDVVLEVGAGVSPSSTPSRSTAGSSRRSPPRLPMPGT